MVGGEHEHHGIVRSIDRHCGKRNRRPRVAGAWLRDDLRRWKGWERRTDEGDLLGCRHDIDVGEWDQGGEEVKGHGERGAAAEEGQIGLWALRRAQGPEARPPAASKDHRVGSTAHRAYRTPAREPAEREGSADPEDATEEARDPERGATNDEALLELCAHRVPE